MDSLKIKISKGLLLIISVIIVVVVATFIICKVRNQIIINKAKEYKCEEIYITLFDKHKELIRLL